mmetsp:Transcript_15774/g.30500  ORF Transcript_15774/g.30500 Transcript_15774/m.30500 type:complete len:419 (-) Transcript_15774:104-1360(-)
MASRRWLFLSRVWPETDSSAAGVRSWEFLRLASQVWQEHVSFGTISKHKEKYARPLGRDLGVEVVNCAANRAAEFRIMLEEVQPTIVVFDTFVTEEVFSWQVQQAFPECMRIVDTQDMHSLRRAREVALSEARSMEEVMSARPDASDPTLQRELASLHRSDLNLFVSKDEMESCASTYGIPSSKLGLAPLLGFERDANVSNRKYEATQDFYTIGNFKHAPNRDAVQWLAEDIWPRIRQRLPNANLHIFGAYADAPMMSLHNPDQGFHMRGYLRDVKKLSKFRVCLAPLRFGAGIKGKITEAWSLGVPVVTTPVGGESLAMESDLCSTADEIIDRAVDLYEHLESWDEARNKGFSNLAGPFSRESMADNLRTLILDTESRLLEARKHDYLQHILFSQGQRATEFFARWVEMKELLRKQT